MEEEITSSPTADDIEVVQIEAGKPFIVKGIMTVEGALAAKEAGAAAIAPGWVDWLGLALVCIVLPAILTWAFGLLLRKIGWIKKDDLKLPGM